MVKSSILYAFYNEREFSALDILIEALNDPARTVRSSALSICLYGPHDIKSIKEDIFRMYNDKSSYGRYELFYLIGRQRRERSLCSPEFLINALDDNHYFIKRTAMVQLAFHSRGHLIPKNYEKLKKI